MICILKKLSLAAHGVIHSCYTVNQVIKRGRFDCFDCFIIRWRNSLDIDIPLVNTGTAQMLWYSTSKSLKYSIRRTFKCYKYQMKVYPPCAQSLWLKLYKLVWSPAHLNAGHNLSTNVDHLENCGKSWICRIRWSVLRHSPVISIRDSHLFEFYLYRL